MLIRISLIIAIIAGLATAGLSFIKVKEKVVALQTDLKNTQDTLATTQADLSSTKKTLATTKKDLDNTRTELTGTQQERDQFRKEAEDQTKRALTLADNLTKTTRERDEAQGTLQQWNVLGVNPDQVKTLIGQNKQLQNDRAVLTQKLADLQRDHRTATNTLAKILGGEDFFVALRPECRGKVMVVDPKYDFVVLDFGENKGALEDGVLLVNRNGRLVAKVQIRSVQPDRCIANVMPGWKLGEVMEGDEAIPSI